MTQFDAPVLSAWHFGFCPKFNLSITDSFTLATAGTANTGGGGGGGSAADGASTGAAGGSGVVILRVPTANYSGTTTGSPTVTTDGTDTVMVFNASGSYTG